MLLMDRLPTELLNLIGLYFCTRGQSILRAASKIFASSIQPPPLHIVVGSTPKCKTLPLTIKFIELLHHQESTINNECSPKPEIWLTSTDVIVTSWISIHCPLTIVGDPLHATNVLGSGFMIQSSSFPHSYFNLSHVNISSNMGQGIFCQGPLQLKLNHVVVFQSASSGMLLRENVQGVLKNCSIRNSKAMGLFVSSSTVECHNLTCTNNTWSGVCAVAGSNIFLKNEFNIHHNGSGPDMTSCFDLKAVRAKDSIEIEVPNRTMDGSTCMEEEWNLNQIFSQMTKGGTGKVSMKRSERL